MRKNNLLFTSVLAAILLVGCQQSADKSGEKNDTTVQTTIQPVKQASIANNADQILDKQEVPVLCYHRIEDGKKGDYTVSPATFSAHMQVLADSGYTSILPAQLFAYLLYIKNLPEKPVMITFDDSRTEHFNIAAPVMEKLGFRGVFFIMTITYNKKKT